MIAFLKAPACRAPCQGASQRRHAAVDRKPGLYMRPDVGLMQALRAPLAFNLKGLRARRPQNQLRLRSMADMEVRPGVAQAAVWPVMRVRGLGRGGVLAGLAAVLALVLAALLASGAGELILLALLALLAVAGVFLVVGLVSGHLRVSDRAAE